VQVFHTNRGFSAAGRPGEERFTDGGSFGYLALLFG
jgi:hypothetical protein